MTAAEYADRARRFLTGELWSFELQPRSVTAAATRVLQFGVMVAQGFSRDQLLLRASALTYIGALSLIPLLAVALSIANAVGVGANLAEVAAEQLTVVTPEAKQQILELIEQARQNLPGLGALGGAILFVTTVLALRHAESTLNDVWGVTRGRTWMRRFADYLAVLVIAPVFTGVALSIGPILQSGPVVGRLLEFPLFETFYSLGLRQLPTVLLVLGFTFVYWFLPNTKVRISSALLGGLIAAVLITLSQILYVKFSIGTARANAMFGTFAQLPLLLTWIYIAFAIFLLGAEVAFAHQNLAQYRREVQGEALEPAEREAVGLRIAVEVARVFRDREPPRTAEQFAEHLNVPVRMVRDLLQHLEEASVVAECGGEDREGAYLLAGPAEGLHVSDVLLAFRGVRHPNPPGTDAASGAVGEVLGAIDGAVAGIAERRSLADVLAQVPAPVPGERG
ncbi:MAG: YihY family inner membrane protein [Proteobacteria bacterium]|nr:YihY family inner membrane protein [Pseudomonadota bacterium]